MPPCLAQIKVGQFFREILAFQKIGVNARILKDSVKISRSFLNRNLKTNLLRHVRAIDLNFFPVTLLIQSSVCPTSLLCKRGTLDDKLAMQQIEGESKFDLKACQLCAATVRRALTDPTQQSSPRLSKSTQSAEVKVNLSSQD